MDDFDIYDDLDDFTEKAQKPAAEVTELSEQLKNIKEQLNEAQNKYEQLINVNKTLKYNISTILLTARRELTRKEDRINSLIKEKDEIIFRRSGPNSRTNQVNNKSTMYQHRAETARSKPTNDKSIQTEPEHGKIVPIKRNKFVQTVVKWEAKKLPSTSVFHKVTQTDDLKHLQTIRYAGWHNTVFKTEQVEIKDYIEKKHQIVQTDKSFGNFVAKESNNNSKSTTDDSDAVESLLSLSKGYHPNSGLPQKLLNDVECEKLLANPKIILEELMNEVPIEKPKPVKSKPNKKLANKKNPKLKEGLNDTDIYDLYPIHQIDKSKPIRQYGSGKGKHILNQLPDSNNTPPDNEEVIIIKELDTLQIAQIIKVHDDSRTSPPAPSKTKKIEIENVKQSRKQKFTDIKTNCNLEHIPTEVIKIQPKKVGNKPKPKITRSRKRRLNALFDESMDEVLPTKKVRSQAPVVEALENIPEIKFEKDIAEVSQKMSHSTPLALPNIENQKKSLFDEPEPPPLPPSPKELPPPPPPSDNPEPPSKEREPPPLPSSPVALPPPPLSSPPVELPLTNTDREIKPICPESESQTPAATDISPLLDQTTNLENTESHTVNETPTCSQDFEKPAIADSTLNSSIEIKMSSTSYKIETHGDETTVYIRRNKKKKKRTC